MTPENPRRWEKKEAKTLLAILVASVMVALTLVLLVSFAVVNYGSINQGLERQEIILCVLLVEPEDRISQDISHCFINDPQLENLVTTP
jgi:hypothetical protein